MNSPSKPNNYPLAYTEGHTWFYGRKFFITSDVLIPRPETESIIDYVVSQIPTEKNQSGFGKGLSILDIGTGSGIIAITLKLELPRATITATDISKEALTIAKKNAELHNASISFVNSDLFQAQSIKNRRFDIITANLPYVDPDWDWLDKSALAHEPAQALYAKDHGLALIKKLIQQAPAHLNSNGTLILEHDPIQFSALSEFAKSHPTSISPYVTNMSLRAKRSNRVQLR